MLRNLNLPSDIGTDLNLESSDGKSSNLPPKPSSLEDYEHLKQELDQDPNNIKKWDSLFKALEEKFEELYDKDQPETITPGFKQFIYKSYQDLLNRFPYLTSYWKHWSIFEYKLNGIESSINVLNKSVEVFSTSIGLWGDYLSALVSQFELLNDDQQRQEQIRFIRLQYNLALKLNGFHFNSHPLWDKIFEFESLINDSSLEVLNLYLTVVKIPLYQYSQYFKQFLEINKNYEMTDILNESDINEYLEKFNKSSVNELSQIEKHQIIDDFSYKIFNNTQRLVNEKWQYESSIVYHEFSLENLSEIENELKNWITYLNYEIENYKKDSNEFQFNLVVSLFERSLIPNCLNSKIWLKYLAFLNFSNLSGDEKFERMKFTYNKSINKFIPLDDNFIRFNYVDFLMKYGQFHLNNEYLFDLIKMFGGLSTNSKIYLKKQYLESIEKLVMLWSQVLPSSKFIKISEDMISNYFDTVDRYTKKIDLETNDNQDLEEKIKFKNIYIDILSKLLNDESICTIISFYLNYLQENSDMSTPLKIRKLFNKYYRENALKKSIKFWRFFVEFEGLINHNSINLRNIMKYIKTNTQLPKPIIDSLIDLHYDILSANIARSLEADNIIDDALIKYDNDLSNSLIINSSMRKRVSNNNYLIKEIEETKLSKLQSHNQLQYNLINREDELIKIAKKHSNHPGILIDAVPEITNRIMREGNWITLDEPHVEVPSFPTFKNVEKASLPINYPTE